jgi:hypothetical protein
MKKTTLTRRCATENSIYFVIAFCHGFGWSMQFIIIEWEVYSLTKNPLSLGIIGLMEVIPAISMALFAGHIVDQRKKKVAFQMYFGVFNY